MLVLTRKANQQLVIGENIRITVLGIKGNSIRLGIEAPAEVRILRREISGTDAVPTDARSQGDSAPARSTRNLNAGETHTFSLHMDGDHITSRASDERARPNAQTEPPQGSPVVGSPAGLSTWVQMVRAN